jgi:type VI secretion system protein ImpA
MSARWDGQQLVQPITAERPCGENLEDTPLLASFDGFRLFGNSTPLDSAPDWIEMRDRSLDALTRSKDLRLLAYLAAALLRTEGLAAFSGTLTVASQWLDTYWSETYPLVDDDAILRRNALNCLADQMAVVDGLRRVPLVSSRQHGTFSLRDVDIATGLQTPDDDGKPDEAQINAAFAAMPIDDLKALEESAVGAVTALKSIDARMRHEAGPEAAPSFDGLSAPLLRMQRLLRTHLASRAGANGDAAAAESAADAVASPLKIGAVRSRQDATRALDAVAEFFRHHEPSSPIPLFLERAKRLVSKDFLEVLADIAPDALAQARAAGGLKRE